MIEQLSLFGETDPFHLATQWIVRQYEREKAFSLRCDESYFKKHGFGEWLLDKFSSYSGGTTHDTILEEYGYWFYNYSPKGLELDAREFEERVKFQKAKILKAFGIKDDGKDVLKDD